MSGERILIVDDEPDIRQTISEILEDEGFKVEVAEDAVSARRQLANTNPDLILLDIWMPDTDGISLLKEWVASGDLRCPVVMMSGHGTVETAVQATKLGATDYLEKPVSLQRLLHTVESALEAAAELPADTAAKRKALIDPTGRSAVMQRLREQVRRLAQHDARLLMLGEAGTGKKTLARYLHRHSTYSDEPFVDVSVHSLQGGDPVRELFGEGDEAGIFERTGHGTVFISDVGELDKDTQALLLGALESNQFQRRGGSSDIPLNARIITATARSLEQMVEMGQFLQELYYQLHVVSLEVPALRDHREDIPELIEHFVDHSVAHEDMAYRRFGVAAQNQLRNHHWQGNIRELQNVVKQVLILGNGEEVTAGEIRQALGTDNAQPEPNGKQQAVGVSMDLPLRDAREQFERAYLEYQLERAGGSVAKMAMAVGMERTHLYRKLRSLGITIK